ncbi:MAG: 4'-phosphopantetheinyl transferase superfamily protein, partial [Rhodospirillaceae bacterium]|nr:4'-phosphopantetheinyl transferase superfamily protein [Rhodospirillaceae bacterium]
MRLIPIDLWAVSLVPENAADGDYRRLLNQEERARADRYLQQQDAERWTVARATLRLVLASYLDGEPGDIAFEYDTYNKPFLPPDRLTEPLHFNLSHSDEAMLLAVSGVSAMGIDVEAIKPLDDIVQVARRFFEPTETAALLALPEADQLSAFYRCWTRKEAVLKAVGTGLSTPLDSFTVAFLPGADASMRWGDSWEGPRESLQLTGVTPCPGYIGAL